MKQVSSWYLLNNLITAALVLLAKMWKTNSVPSLNEWRRKVHYVFLMSKLSTFNRARSGSYGAMENLGPHWIWYIDYMFPGMDTFSNYPNLLFLL